MVTREELWLNMKYFLCIRVVGALYSHNALASETGCDLTTRGIICAQRAFWLKCRVRGGRGKGGRVRCQKKGGTRHQIHQCVKLISSVLFRTSQFRREWTCQQHSMFEFILKGQDCGQGIHSAWQHHDPAHVKHMHNIGKVSVNASILYKNQEICNKTNLWKFQLILLFLLRENSKNAFSIFVFILMAGVFVSQDENSLLDLISLIIRKR